MKNDLVLKTTPENRRKTFHNWSKVWLFGSTLTLISFHGGCHCGFGIVGAFRGTIPCENGVLLSPVATSAFDGGAILSAPPDAIALSVMS